MRQVSVMQDAFYILHGDLLVAALAESVKAFRGKPGTWSSGWELRRPGNEVIGGCTAEHIKETGGKIMKNLDLMV